MDSNENNNDSVTVPDLDSTHVKIEPVEKCENPEAVRETIYLKLKQDNSIFEKKLQDIQLNQKRKVAEGSEVVMDNEDSQNSNESVKRRRYSNSQNPIANNSQSTAEKQTYTLLLTNSPGIWSSQEVINYVKDECGVHISSINDSREDNTEEDFQIRLRFETKKHLHQVLTKLKEKEAQGKLSVQQIDNVRDEAESDAESDTTVQLQTNEPKIPQADENAGSKTDPIADLDSKDFYIREDYLDTLGIKPPLTSWVIVTNFRCDKSELKEVLGLAGKVLICSVNMDSNKYANVMYSHPLEAVQAVSMLNGQQYYGKNLKVKMNNTTENKTLLPKGLVGVGPGLGKYGKPLPDLGDQYKRFRKGKTSNLDACLFQTSFLKKIGITIDEEVANFVRLVTTPSQNSQNDTDSERNESPIDKNNAQKSESNFGPVGQKPGSNIPVIRPQNKAPLINKIPPRPQMQNPMPVQNSMQMRAPIRGPNPSGMGSRIPGPMPMGPGPRPGFPMANPGPMYPNCPPVPGLESGNDSSKNVNNMMNGPRFPMPGPMSPMVGPGGPMVGPGGPMVGPGGPMGGPNRFPGPGPMMGPRPGHVMGPRGPMPMTNGPIRPNMPNMFWSNVRMFKGPDPVMLQITNLPPTTNFVNLGQKLTELGHVVFLELTTPGCANVRFASPADADRCLQNYHQVMG